MWSFQFFHRESLRLNFPKLSLYNLSVTLISNGCKQKLGVDNFVVAKQTLRVDYLMLVFGLRERTEMTKTERG